MDKSTVLRYLCQTCAPVFTASCLLWPTSAWPDEELPGNTITTRVKEVRQLSNNSDAPYVVYLHDAKEDRVLPIWISSGQALSIASVLNSDPFPRPLTHDLMSAILAATESQVESIVIDALSPLGNETSGGTYFATLTMTTSSGRRLKLDARPSDAMALAVRLGLSVEVAQIIMERNSLALEPTEDPRKPDVADPYY